MMGWIRAWKKRRTCFHHDHRDHESWIRSRHIDFGRKMYWCTHCERTWFL
jgi:hypothetical protein